MRHPLEDALQQAEAALADGDLEDAVAFADEALGLAPEQEDALEIKATALAELDDWETADALYARLLARDGGNPGFLLGAADVKIRHADDDPARLDEGLALLERARPLVRRDELLLGEVQLLRGLALSQLGRLEEALAALDDVLELDGDHAEARLERGVVLFELARFPEAKRTFEALTRDFPEEAWSYHYLGLLAERRGERAEAWFEKARRLAPEDFPPPVHLGAEAFDAAVAEAIARLPDHARPHLDNVIITVEPVPSDEELREGLSPAILGVFHGTPLDERSPVEATHHQTARITLYQANLERFARTRDELIEEIRITVLHEVGHLLGLDEDELAERGLD